MGREFRSRFNIPVARAILFVILLLWAFQFKFSLIVSPRNRNRTPWFFLDLYLQFLDQGLILTYVEGMKIA